MALEREKAFGNAERLLKQGRIKPALDEYRRIAEEAPRDVLTLNRIGDALARAGRNEDAVGYYERAGDHFAQAGFYPRAVAILKKIVKLDPGRTDVLVKLADLNVRQRLPGEARPYFLQAADVYLRARQFGKAREVYERLVETEPGDQMNRVRLAEARAVEGDPARAAEELLLVAGSMASGGRLDDAERTYRRAAELLPDRTEPIAGLATCLAKRGRADDALHAIDGAMARRPDDVRLLGEKLVLLEALGRHAAAAALLAGPAAPGLRDDELLRAFAEAASRGSEEELLSRLDPVVDAWRRSGRSDRLGTLLDRLALLVERGWAPALERLRTLRIEEGAPPQTIARLLDRLIAAHEGRGDAARASELRAELSEFDARMAAVSAEAPSPGPAAPPAAVEPAETDEERAIPLAAEAPAVPLSPQDHEVVSGHLTEAEVFQKYGLHNEALQQLREVAKRFPGHVEAVTRLVEMLRTRPDREELRDALVTLALARRAAGDPSGARAAADEAAEHGAIPAAALDALVRLGLSDPVRAPVGGSRSPEPAPPSPAPPAATPLARTPPAPRAAPLPERDDEDLVIEFEDDGIAAAAPPSPQPPAPPGGRRERFASPDMIEEIAFYLDQGMADEALKKIAALRTLGFSGEDLDRLEGRAVGARPVEEITVEDEGEAPGSGETRLDESDLSSITAALEAELAQAPAVSLAPAAEGEQSLDEVFEQFKKHVDAEVGDEDPRTRYDLGIAYKEMGLLDDALAEFQAASRAPELFRDACSMLALCHRERGDTAEAVRWYREALAAPGDETDPLSGVRYDLAEVLVERGDLGAALDLFQEVMNVDPSYREVRRQVSELEARLRG